ncbi:MAG TPA: arsenite methyltransferase [Bacteroidota bacterium]
MNTANPTEIKNVVKNHYSEIVERSEQPSNTTCCGSDCGCSSDFDVMTEDYSKVSGYVREADLALGCGIPTESARIRPGDTVLDLGSGAGNDCFVARSIVGDSGRVIGVDMTEKMIAKANENKAKLGFRNVEFRLGDIEEIPVESHSVDVVVSNCVLNLVPDKTKAFAEMFRVTKPGGHFAISDIVLRGILPEKIQNDAVMYAGCVAGAIQKDEYLRLLEASGFKKISVVKERETPLPNEFLLQYLSLEELRAMKKDRVGIFSITVVGEKPKN